MKKISTIILIFFITSIYAQIEFKIKNVKVNGVSIPDNSPIEFNGATSVVVNFKVEFTKPSEMYIGGVQHVIGTYNSNGQFHQLITPEQFTLPAVTNNGFSGIWTKTLYASDYSYNENGNYLVAILNQTDALQNGEWETNHVPIKRGPLFSLNPSSIQIECGNTTSRTFTISNSGTNMGTKSYNWNIGNGWSGTVNSNMASITLTPINGNVLPSNVSVTPIYNGVTQPTLTCSVTPAPFTTNAVIQGSGIVCPGSSATFNLTNSGSFTNVSWSVSPSSVAVISSSNNSSVTIQALTSGTFTINAVVQNACNQTITIPRTFDIGVPSVSPIYNTILGVSDWYSTNYISPTTASVHYVQNATSYQWTITGSTNNSNCTNRPKFSNGSTTSMTTYTNQVNINWGGCTGNFVLWCKPINSCGVSHAILGKNVTVGNASESPCNFNPIGAKMRNPIKEDTDIVLSIHHSQLPCKMVNNQQFSEELTIEQVEAIKYNVEIYDFFGRLILTKNDLTSEIIIQDTNLSKGKYIINISNDLGYIKREVLIVE